jgi:hypothetical protein
MICPLADLMNMKLNPNSTQPQIFEKYRHPWYEFNERLEVKDFRLNRPNPPSKEAVERAKFVDKTYHWSGSNSVRSGNKRSTS